MEVYKTPCKNCLFTKNRIVSLEAAKDIIQGCAQDQTYFICHKSSEEGGEVCCKSFYDKFPHLSQLIRMCKRFEGGIKFIEQPNHEMLTPYTTSQIIEDLKELQGK